jgi:hypothetical protein
MIFMGKNLSKYAKFACGQATQLVAGAGAAAETPAAEITAFLR